MRKSNEIFQLASAFVAQAKFERRLKSWGNASTSIAMPIEIGFGLTSLRWQGAGGGAAVVLMVVKSRNVSSATYDSFIGLAVVLPPLDYGFRKWLFLFVRGCIRWTERGQLSFLT